MQIKDEILCDAQDDTNIGRVNTRGSIIDARGVVRATSLLVRGTAALFKR
jgi:hypothetical protein